MIAIVDYNAGNIGSVTNVLDNLGVKYVVTSDPEEIKKARKVIFPGVGRASQAMKELKKRKLVKIIQEIKAPFLGICLGMQLLFAFSDEDNTKCLGIMEGKVKKFKGNGLKVPQIGWNSLDLKQADPLLKGIKNSSYIYFVNSYYADTDPKYVLANATYGQTVAAVAVKKDNFYGLQFHPEKSGKIGQQILKNFVLA